jgi:hypothetical protein
MFVEYIPRFRTYEDEGRILPLQFFGYVAGGFQGRVDTKLQRIANSAGVSGFAVTAENIVKLVREHRQKPYSQEELLRLFTLNREINSADFASVRDAV